MRLLTRYVLGEIVPVFVITLMALTILMVLVGAGREAIGHGLGLLQIVQLIPYLLPQALIFAIPGTILFSVSTVYGRMSASNEIVAIKSLGLSPMVVVWPALALSLALSIAAVWLNDLAQSWAYNGMQQVVIDAVEDIAYGMLRSQKSFSTPDFAVTVKDVEGRQLIDPHFSLQDSSGPASIHAESAEFRSKPGSGLLSIRFRNATVDAQGHHVELPEFEKDIDLNPGAGHDAPPSHLPLSKIPESTVRQKEMIAQLEQRMVARAGFQMMTGDFDGLRGDAWAAEARALQVHKYNLYRMQTEPPRRWANGFSCICFALVGSAMAIRMRNSDALTSFFLCFGPILLVYYPALAFGIDRAKAGVINPYVVWLANMLMVAWGMWLLKRVMRY